MTILNFTASPPAAPAYWRALLAMGKPRQAGALPDLQAVREHVRIEASAVAAFRTHFGLPAAGPVPPTFAHAVLAAPLHLQLLTHPAFPLRVLGTVHVRNPIRQLRSLRAGEAVTVQVRFGGLRAVHNGVEHDLLTEVLDTQGVCIWEACSTNLLRDPALPPREAAAPVLPLPARRWERQWPVVLGAAAGRRYAAISGDWNPIHLSALTARLFGFRRAILHGMYTYGKVLAVLEAHLPGGTLACEARFRKPVFLPGRVEIRALRSTGPEAWDWQVQDASGSVIHAEGSVARL